MPDIGSRACGAYLPLPWERAQEAIIDGSRSIYTQHLERQKLNLQRIIDEHVRNGWSCYLKEFSSGESKSLTDKYSYIAITWKELYLDHDTEMPPSCEALKNRVIRSIEGVWTEESNGDEAFPYGILRYVQLICERQMNEVKKVISRVRTLINDHLCDPLELSSFAPQLADELLQMRDNEYGYQEQLGQINDWCREGETEHLAALQELWTATEKLLQISHHFEQGPASHG